MSFGTPRMSTEVLLAHMASDAAVAGAYVLLIYIIVHLNRQKHVTIFVPQNSYLIAFLAVRWRRMPVKSERYLSLRADPRRLLNRHPDWGTGDDKRPEIRQRVQSPWSRTDQA